MPIENLPQTAEAAAHASFDLVPIVILLAVPVLTVPLFKRLGLGSVLGYLAAGLAIGPFGFGFFSDAQSILHIAELGVVLFLFIIGLEMRPSRLWAMRGEIFGLGLVQDVSCLVLIACAAAIALGYPLVQSFVAAAGFVLTSTAIVMHALRERRILNQPKGRRILAALLFEDLAIIPLLALTVFLAPGGEEFNLENRLTDIAIGLAAIATLIAAGRWLLDPMFRLLGNAKAREVMTAAALLVVLGSALALQAAGLSMAMGAFLAGVLLSESSFRHQLEADIEPFRGILLGLFFLGVGMVLDIAIVSKNLPLIGLTVVSFVLLNMLGIYTVARLFGLENREAVERSTIMAQGGEFAFVLYATAASTGVIDGSANAILTATVIISMTLNPLLMLAHDRFAGRAKPSTDSADVSDDRPSNVLLIGFGRFGKIVSRPLLAHSDSVAIIDTNPDGIRAARGSGMKIHYGDGTRIDILRSAGAGHARLIIIAADDRDAVLKIVQVAKAAFPTTPILARAFDRAHAAQLIRAGVAYQIRETFESALVLAGKALSMLDVGKDLIADIMVGIRRQDNELLQSQLDDDIDASREFARPNKPEQ